MRGKVFLSRLSILLLAFTGCYSTGPEIKPRTQEEVWKLPPEDDRRYCMPPEYPKETLNNDDLLKKSSKDSGMSRGGFGSPTRGMGGLNPN
jgi:hypothetical protein